MRASQTTVRYLNAMVTGRRFRRLLAMCLGLGMVGALWLINARDSETTPDASKAEEAPSDSQSEAARAHAPPPRPAITEGVLHGQVLSDQGEPVAGAEVSLTLDGATPSPARHLQVDASGTFEVPALPAGLYFVTAWKSGLISNRVPAVIRAGATTEVQLSLQAGASLTGTVRDAANGDSVSACQLVGAFGVSACDRGGRFVVGPLQPGTFAFRVSAPGYTPRDVTVSLSTRSRVTADVSLSRGAQVSGTVFDPDHKPFAGARVRTSHYVLEGMKPAEVETTSDAQGRFTLDGVAPGRVQFQARARGYAETPGVELQLAGGESRDGIELTLTTGGAIAGVVKDAAGQVIEGAQVQALRLVDKSVAANDRSVADGSFRLDGLVEGEYTLVATTTWARGVSPGVQVNGRDEANATIVLGSDSIDGRVRTENGSPVPNAVVSVFSSHAAGLGEVNAVTDSEGRFRADGLTGGPFRVQAHAEGLGTVEERGVAAGAHVELVLSGSGRIEGTVTGSSGRGLESFEIRLVPKDGSRGGSVAGRYRTQHFVSPDGSFRLEDVPAGKYVVKAEAPAAVAAEKPVEVSAGGAASVTLVLSDGAIVTGRLHLPDGSPGVGCDVHPSSDPVVTDGTGMFKLTGVDRRDGFVFVWARCANGSVATGRATIDSNGRGEVTLQAKPPRDNNFDRANVDFGGVGMSLRTKDGRIYATSVFEGGPAFLAGIQDGDQVVTVDGWSTDGASIQDVVGRIRGPLGQPVVIGIVRPGTGVTFEAHAERARIALD